MSVFNELFPSIDDSFADDDAELKMVLQVICALADEVRALRVTLKQLSRSPEAIGESRMAAAAAYAPKAAESERLQYPFCDACGIYHHPDHYLCKKLAPEAEAQA